MSYQLKIDLVRIDNLKEAAGSRDQALLEESLKWLRSKFEILNPQPGNNQMALEVSREHLRAVIFEGWPAKDLHPWMFDDPYGYELEKSNQWDEYTNSLIPVCIRAIFAQYPDYKEDNGSSYKPFKDCFDTLSQKGLLIPEIEQLWNCLLHGRSFFGETPVYFNSLHGYLYNRELAQILEYFPSNQVEFDPLKQKIPAKNKKVERILNAGYLESCIYVREGLIRLCETGLDLFVEAG